MLDGGAKVKVSVMFRGREIAHPDIGMKVLRRVAEDLVDDAKIEKVPTFEGRFLSMVLSSGKSQVNQKKTNPKKKTREKNPCRMW